eukprot:CAMPEP_0172675282 /NCGR_PEP_ID=MMETSP1074-20121228/13181_1 /TAXON_ID=2916 /ORGANISM="Ceratium fusus, Strain PA161109" /LENGTH=380 /DNA_ID=CAMNT_0013492735 /DNA_START=127 /DNA_END=1269 /DNA_ORIENTATION=+
MPSQENAHCHVFHSAEAPTLQRQHDLTRMRSALAAPSSRGLATPVVMPAVQPPRPDRAVHSVVRMHSYGILPVAKNTAQKVETTPLKLSSAASHSSIPLIRQRWHSTAVLSPRKASPACSVASRAMTARGRGMDTPSVPPTSIARPATYRAEAPWNTTTWKLHVHAPPGSPPSDSGSTALPSGNATPRVAIASPRCAGFSCMVETPSQAHHSSPATPINCRVVGRFPSLVALHQALLQAHITRDSQPTVASSQELHGSVSNNGRTTGIFPLQGAAPDASAVCQQLEEAKEENASLKKQINTATKMVGCLRQHSRNLMLQIQREILRSQRLEQLLIDCNLPQFGAIASVSTTEVGTGTCTAEVAAQGQPGVGVTKMLPSSC